MKRQTTATRQRGVASIEFAGMFVLVFMLFYGMVGYFVPLLLAASYQEVASEAAREAILHNYDRGGDSRRLALAKAVVEDSWLPDDWKSICKGYDGYLRQSPKELSACIRHAAPASIIPQVALFGWRFPVLPQEIKGEATILRQAKEEG
ncbi:TadE/TadG family type IV pilus assembly protein [Pseudomonas sp. FME51]|uniref:TadE/TadG family type IV pilus assembly protein n=1 Tax=Pseudomonas sp. FME51 TaxID=2742609 RepID=UPI001D020F7C|nr:TadE family protein [Pseudomonas sp. FME51]